MTRGAILFLFSWNTAHAEQFLYFPLGESHSITCGFCCPDYPLKNVCHSAIDYRASNSTPVFAAAAGTVELVVNGHPAGLRKKGGFGNHIRIRHANNYLTIYAHLARDTISVQQGMTVVVGQPIALSDNSGLSFGPHLHFEVRNPQSQKVNPYGDPPDYQGGCGPNALWATCPPQPYRDADGDGYSIAEGDCMDEGETPEGVPAAAVHPDAVEVCNYTDDNCDGVTDEGFEGVLTPCDGADADLCAEGITTCDVGGASTSCTDTSLDTVEICNNGVDDNCDGVTDEDGICSGDECETACPADMVLIEGVCPFCVDLYEASVASGELGSAAGEGTTVVAQAVAGVMPQGTITWYQANVACVNAGKRLCTAPEWQVACAGASGWEYPYGPSYVELACNDAEYSLANGFTVRPTGSLEACVTPTGIYDLLGNVWEWTATAVPETASQVIKGGAFNMYAVACQTDLNIDPLQEVVQPDNGWSNGGFRCCR